MTRKTFRSEVYCPSSRDVRFMVCPSYRDSTVIPKLKSVERFFPNLLWCSQILWEYFLGLLILVSGRKITSLILNTFWLILNQNLNIKKFHSVIYENRYNLSKYTIGDWKLVFHFEVTNTITVFNFVWAITEFIFCF